MHVTEATVFAIPTYGLISPQFSRVFGRVAMEIWPVFYLWFNDNRQVHSFLILASFQPLVTLFT